MARIHDTTATLRFFGDELDPNEITTRLGKSPTVGVAKGGVWYTKNGTEKIARTGLWRLKAQDREPGDINAQIDELLGGLSDDLSIWQDLTNRFDSSVFCGLFMNESNEGMELSPKTMADLGTRNLTILFDIYDPPKDN